MTTTRTLTADEYQIGWIAALSTERAAATALLDELHNQPTDFAQHHADNNAYTWGHVSGHNVVIASLPAGVYGLAAATTTAQGLISSLPSIKIGLLVGVGAGIPESGLDIRLGDVAVSKPEGTTGGVVQYDIGKSKADGQWERVGVLHPPPTVLLKALAKLQAEHEIQDTQIPTILREAGKKHPKFALNYSHPGVGHDRLFHTSQKDSVKIEEETQRPERHDLLPQIHYGTIASGNVLVKDAHARERIVTAIVQPCICLEMEAAGLMNACPCLVIRGICDYADSHKNDIWHKYASATAAAFTKELLYHVPQFELNRTQKIGYLLENIQSSIDGLMEGIKQTDQETQQQKQHERTSDFRQALYTCPYIDRKNMNSTRVAGTCMWFTGHQRFQEWQDGRGPGLLWTSADPGCGKSVLARYLIDEVLPASGKKVCYFFFKDGFLDQKSSTNAVCALLRQLLEFYPESITSKMLERFNNDRRLYITSFHTLWEAFTDIISRAPSDEIVCVLDALDECQEPDRHKLIKLICEYAQKPSTTSKVKFILTSRFSIDIKNGFYDFEKSWSRIHLSGEGDEEVKIISQEIDIVVKHRIREISLKRQLTDNEEQFLTTKLMSQPQRTYLWAYLTLDIIERMPEFSRGTVSRVISQLPNTVDEAYDKILNRSPDKDKAKLLLHLIVATERPLSLEELSLMLVLNGEQLSLSGLDDFLEPQERFRTTIRMLCGLFVVVEDARVYLFHQTAREFLISRKGGEESHDDKDKTASLLWKGALHLDVSHRMVVERCLWLMKLREYSGEFANTSTLALFNYCDRFWPYHFRNSDIKSDDGLTSLAIPYSDIRYPQNCKVWNHRPLDGLSSEAIQKLDVYERDGDRRLNCLCLLGLTEIVRRFLNGINSIYKESRVLSRALCWAAFGSHTDTAHLLLRYGALTNSDPLQDHLPMAIPQKRKASDSGDGREFFKLTQTSTTSSSLTNKHLSFSMSLTPLHYAVQEQNLSLAKVLLSNGAQVDATEHTLLHTPLHMAAERGNHNIIQLLLQHGANKNLVDTVGRTPFHLFLVSPPHDDSCGAIISLLWNEERHHFETSRLLWLAADYGCKSCLIFMLRNNTRPYSGWQVAVALTRAIKCDFDESAKLLIEDGADVNTRVYVDTKPLIQAAARKQSSVSIIRYLLDHGADIHIRDDKGSSCLHHVWTIEALEMLVAHGADINAKDSSGTTPLLQVVLDGGRFADQSDGLSSSRRSNESPLYDAMVRLGADPDIKNERGQTARTLPFQTSSRSDGNFSASCSELRIDGEMNLMANCSRYCGNKIPSTISLRSCLRNDNGMFSWATDGDFFRTARNTRLSGQGSTLVAELLDNEGNWNEASISLDEKIENCDGNLRFLSWM